MVAILTRGSRSLAQMRLAMLIHVTANQKLVRSLRWSRGGALRLTHP
jgi:hypothetical protein